MFHIIKHELRLVLRDPKFWIPFIVPPLVLAASQAIAVSRYGGQIMEGMEGYMMLLLGCLMAPMSAPLAGDFFAGEKEKNTLELLQLLPISPNKIFFGKMFAILPFPIFFVLLADFIYWFSHFDISKSVAFASILGSLSAILLTTSFSLVISLRVKSVRASTHISLFLVIPLLLFVQFFHKEFLASVLPSIFLFIVAVACTLFLSFVNMKKFSSM